MQHNATEAAPPAAGAAALPPRGLGALQTRAEFQAANSHLFPSVPAVDYFLRRHRAELVQRRAILKRGQSWLIVPATFEAVFLDIGMRDAQRAIEEEEAAHG